MFRILLNLCVVFRAVQDFSSGTGIVAGPASARFLAGLPDLPGGSVFD